MMKLLKVLRRHYVLQDKRWFVFDTETMQYRRIQLKTIGIFLGAFIAITSICIVLTRTASYTAGIEYIINEHKDSMVYYRDAYFLTIDSLHEARIEYEAIKPRFTYQYAGTPNSKYDDIINTASDIYDVPVAVIKAVIDIESTYKENLTSWAGAKGLMQVIPSNYKALRITDPFNNFENIMGGTELLKRCFLRYGNWEDAIKHYNGGFRGASDNPSRETVEYVKKFKTRVEKTRNIE